MNTLKKGLACFFISFVLMIVSLSQLSADEGGDTINRIRGRGDVRCGVSDGVPGFSVKGIDGRWSGMDVDFCRALTAAVLGDPEKASLCFIDGCRQISFPESRGDRCSGPKHHLDNGTGDRTGCDVCRSPVL